MEAFAKSRISRRAVVFVLTVVLLVNFYLFWYGWPSNLNPGLESHSEPQASPSESSIEEIWTNSTANGSDLTISVPEYHAPNSTPLADRQADFIQHLFKQLNENNPQCRNVRVDEDTGGIEFDAVNDTPRPNYIVREDEMREPLAKAHRDFVAAIQDFDVSKLPYNSGTRGIISSAGGDYFPTFVTSLRMIRRTGCTLPVEVFLIDWSEFEPYICEVVLPKLNAKCIVLAEMIEKAHFPKKNIPQLKGYQIKPFAMLLSSFETFIWMDSDCVPLHEPGTLLDSEPFTSTGLVTWPDYWANTVAPLYFNISLQPEPPMTARQSTESGIMLVSKQQHFLTLSLSTYYNYYGPDYYWALLGQGAYGQGDKDTFIQAAAAVNAPFYAVSEPVATVERPVRTGKMGFAAMVQTDPVQDYNLTSQGLWRVKNSSVAPAPRAFFVHASNPKFNAAGNILEESSRKDGKPGRLWAWPEDVTRRFGYDAERAYWDELKTVTCTLEHAFFSWQQKSGLCEGVQRIWEIAINNPDAPIPGFTGEAPVDFNTSTYASILTSVLNKDEQLSSHHLPGFKRDLGL
ncbi:nucleotide-diphospho-sugar transferase [Penicillium verhagenii]|uniref:nucleotide-diphospho-sugar transferase n=1 Tax=Penicillium verhagenii TaxID=1562060 RepID=UPI002545992F|nr:nucleotide-diphospho-sugar transferase [Penicillium verhagenii]KAJ5924121.1 nucleotide-diphospho-sugar transferase [Penicillium verhagenii]